MKSSHTQNNDDPYIDFKKLCSSGKKMISGKKTGALNKFLEREAKSRQHNENRPPSSDNKSKPNTTSKKSGIMGIVKAYSPASQQIKSNRKSPSVVNNTMLATLGCDSILKNASSKKGNSYWSANKETHNSIKKVKLLNQSNLSRSKMREDEKETNKPEIKIEIAQKTKLDIKTKTPQKPLISKFRPEDYDISEMVGKGKFGEVYLATHVKSGIELAIKIMNKKTMMKYRASRQLVREVKIHESISHPNIIGCYGVLHDEENVYLLMEYAPFGTLYEKLKTQNVGLSHLGNSQRRGNSEVHETDHFCLQIPAGEEDPPQRPETREPSHRKKRPTQTRGFWMVDPVA